MKTLNLLGTINDHLILSALALMVMGAAVVLMAAVILVGIDHMTERRRRKRCPQDLL